MPNWCSTSYVFEGSPDEISGLYNRLKSLCERKEPLLPCDFGKEWVWEWVRKTYPSLRWYFRAEECGCTYYVTNDRKGKYFPERFLIDELQAAPPVGNRYL